MKTFRVEVTHILIGEWEVEAASWQEAEEQFDRMDAKGEINWTDMEVDFAKKVITEVPA